jgi:hypothetical protein
MSKTEPLANCITFDAIPFRLNTTRIAKVSVFSFISVLDTHSWRFSNLRIPINPHPRTLALHQGVMGSLGETLGGVGQVLKLNNGGFGLLFYTVSTSSELFSRRRLFSGSVNQLLSVLLGTLNFIESGLRSISPADVRSRYRRR